MAAPLTPADCDLRDFSRMMIDIPRLFASEFDAIANDAEWRFGVTLWLKSFHQVPAATLPDDDGQLARLCGLGRDVKTWRKAKAVALRGWILCDDGLLYHPVVAEVALEGWLEKLTRRLSSGAGNAERWGVEFDPDPIRAEIGEAGRMLLALNPKSRWLSKQQVVLAMKRSRRDTPLAVPPGSPDVPPGSQGKGREGILEEEAGASSLSGKPVRAKGRASPIEEGFPDKAAVASAAEMIAAAGVRLDPLDHAKRFRSHAKANDRRVVDWRAAWLGWIEIEIGKAPAVSSEPAALEPFVWSGPADLWAAAVGRMGEEWARGYLGKCEARGRALFTTSKTIEAGLRREIGRELTDLGASVVVGSPPALATENRRVA